MVAKPICRSPQLTILAVGLTLGRSHAASSIVTPAKPWACHPKDIMTILQNQDPAVFAAIAAEEVRQRRRDGSGRQRAHE
jgi:hypothetical protein